MATLTTGNRTQQIGQILGVLLALTGRTQSDLAHHLGVHPATITRRFAGLGKWSYDEVEALADYFDVPPSAFRTPPGAVYDFIAGDAEKPGPRRPGLLVKYAPRDSNPEPADYVGEDGVQLDLLCPTPEPLHLFN